MGTRGVITVFPLAKGNKRGYVYMAGDATEENVRKTVAQVDAWIRNERFTVRPSQVAELICASWNGGTTGEFRSIAGRWQHVPRSKLPSESSIEVHVKIVRLDRPDARWGLSIESVQRDTD